MVFVSIFWIFYNLMVIQFSFSDTFGDNIWSFIVILKVLQVIFGFFLELMLSEGLLTSPMEIVGGVVQGLVTFGADDFVDFLNAYFIELGMMMIERTYIGDIVDGIFDYLENTVPKYIRMVQKYFTTSEEEALEEEKKKKLAAEGGGEEDKDKEEQEDDDDEEEKKKKEIERKKKEGAGVQGEVIAEMRA